MENTIASMGGSRTKMSRKKFLSLVFFTIILTRVVLFVSWDSSLMAITMYDSWHHMYTGGAMMLVSLILPKRLSKIILAVGLGLFLDELIHLFHLLGLATSHDYWSFETIATTAAGLITTSLVCLTIPAETRENAHQLE